MISEKCHQTSESVCWICLALFPGIEKQLLLKLTYFRMSVSQPVSQLILSACHMQGAADTTMKATGAPFTELTRKQNGQYEVKTTHTVKRKV